jgi:hypothetical protein
MNASQTETAKQTRTGALSPASAPEPAFHNGVSKTDRNGRRNPSETNNRQNS